MKDHFSGSYDNDIRKMIRLVTTFLHGTNYTEDWDGLTSIDFDKCQDIVKSIKVFI
jgi:hypothetical protein